MKTNLRKLQIGYILKLISKEDILKWSDENILNGRNDDVFIELSSIRPNGDNDSIPKILERYSSNLNKDDFYSFHQDLMRFMHITIKNWKSLQKRLIIYYNLFSDYFDDDFEFWSRLKDDYQLRKEGFSGCMDMPKELKKYLNAFDSKAQNTGKTFFEITQNT